MIRPENADAPQASRGAGDESVETLRNSSDAGSVASSPLGWALIYASRGWRVLPVAAGSKRPVLPRWPEAASADPATITEWFTTRYKGCNIGIATGERSGIVALDVDPGGEAGLSKLCGALGLLPATLEARTARGGAHLLFRYPPGKRLHNRVALLHAAGVDVRGDAGQIVACPSTVGDVMYRWANWGVEPAELPTAWADALEHRIEDPPPPREADAELGTLRNVTLKFLAFGATEGSRNDSLFKAAVELVGAGYGEAEIWRRCLDAADRCVPPLPRDEAIATIRSALSRPRTPYRESFCDLGTPASPTLIGPPVPEWRPFPVDLLPPAVSRFVDESADSMGCEPAQVAIPVLAVLGAAVGTTREIQLKRTWCEPGVIWAAVIVRSGAVKSPALDAATAPLVEAEHRAQMDNAAAADAHEVAMAKYEKELCRWRRQKGETAPPEKPKPPRRVRFVISDCTLESVAPLLAENPRGILLARDEMAAWLKSFDQYKPGGRGGDAAAWLEIHRAGRLIVDRKRDGTIYVPRAAVCICGTIQPAIFERVMRGENLESGLAARLLIARPPLRVKKFSTSCVSEALERGYHAVVRNLLSLNFVESDFGPTPLRLVLADNATALWADWFDRNAVRQAVAESDELAAALAKIEAYAARFALIFQLCDEPRSNEVSADAIRRGCLLADWFARESARLYGELFQPPAANSFIGLIRRLGGTVTPRDVLRHTNRFATADEARSALDALVRSGAGRWQIAEHDGPGRLAERFVLGAGENGDSTKLENAGAVPAT